MIEQVAESLLSGAPRNPERRVACADHGDLTSPHVFRQSTPGNGAELALVVASRIERGRAVDEWLDTGMCIRPFRYSPIRRRVPVMRGHVVG
jgi:hypothetical protein